MSWGYGASYTTVTSLNYRGTSYTDSNTTSNANYRWTNYGLYPSLVDSTPRYITNSRVSSVDVDIEEMISAGIVVCIAAGNRSHKIDVVGGTDYNNFVVTADNGTIYYHRGSSPYSNNALMVGSMDSTVFDTNNDQKATYSEAGPGVNIWAPGTNIMSATSNTNKWGVGSQNYYLNASYKQTNISGTSMATPQVAGVAALVLQLNPTYTPAQVKTSLLNTAGTAIYTTGLTNDYSDTRSLLGSSQKVLYSDYDLPPTTTTTAAPTTTTTTTTAAPTTTTTTTAPTTTTTTTAAPNTFNVTNNGSGNYVINGNSNSTLSVIEGQTYTFNINAIGHPFWIRTVAGVGITNAYNSGVTNNGEDSGTITFVVPYDAPSTLYYNCEYHSSMGGIINVTNVPTTTTTTIAPTTTTTTTEAPPCVQYRCLASKGGYIFWTDCTTGLQSSTSINGGKIKFISSITYPIPEKGSNTKITKITT
jgi:hypothetical protein